MDELARVRGRGEADERAPRQLDAMTGQEAVNALLRHSRSEIAFETV